MLKTKGILALALSLLLVCGVLPAFPVLAAGGVTASIPEYPAGSVVACLEGTTADMNQWTKVYNPSATSRATYTHNPDRGTVTIDRLVAPNSGTVGGAGVTIPAFSTATVKKIVFGIKIINAASSGDITMPFYYNTNDGSQTYATTPTTNRMGNLTFKQGTEFQEYVLDTTGLPYFSGNISKIWFAPGTPTVNIFEVDYIRFVTDEYPAQLSNIGGGTQVADFTKDYSRHNNVLDFKFPNDLDMTTVTKENITINGEPIASVAVSSAVTDGFRVNLGTLRSATRYRVEFPGVKMTGGADAGGQFVFTTGTGILGSTEFTTGLESINSGYFIADNGVLPENVVHDPLNGSVSITTGAAGKDGTFIQMYPNAVGIATDNIKQIVMRVRKNVSASLNYYLLLNGKTQATGTSTDEIQARIYIPASEEFQEYIIDVSTLDQSIWAGQTLNTFRLDLNANAEIEFDYFRIVTYEYETNGMLANWTFAGANPPGLGSSYRGGTPQIAYAQEQDGIKFTGTVGDLIKSGDSANIYINPQTVGKTEIAVTSTSGMASVPLYLSKKAWYPTLTPRTERIASFKIPANSTNSIFEIEPLSDVPASSGNMNFYVSLPVGDIKFHYIRMYPKNYVANPVDVQFRTFELLSGFETDSEAPLSGSLPEGEITAVIGGILNPADGPVAYSLILALYKGDVLEGVEYSSISISAGRRAAAQQSVSITVPQGGGYDVKAFLWNEGNLQPITGALTPDSSQMQ